MGGCSRGHYGTRLVYIISGHTQELQTLSRRANDRIQNALVDSTKRLYSKMFRNFVSFAIYAKFHLSFHQHLIFWDSWFVITLLIQPFVTTSQQSNQMSLCLAFHSTPLRTTKYFKKSLARHAPLSVKIKSIIDTHMLTQIVKACDYLYMGFVYKAAILSLFSVLSVFLI